MDIASGDLEYLILLLLAFLSTPPEARTGLNQVLSVRQGGTDRR